MLTGKHFSLVALILWTIIVRILDPETAALDINIVM
jgi:hypothetical protein